jgi:hypothetical protein
MVFKRRGGTDATWARGGVAPTTFRRPDPSILHIYNKEKILVIHLKLRLAPELIRMSMIDQMELAPSLIMEGLRLVQCPPSRRSELFLACRSFVECNEVKEGNRLDDERRLSFGILDVRVLLTPDSKPDTALQSWRSRLDIKVGLDHRFSHSALQTPSVSRFVNGCIKIHGEDPVLALVALYWGNLMDVRMRALRDLGNWTPDALAVAFAESLQETNIGAFTNRELEPVVALLGSNLLYGDELKVWWYSYRLVMTA